MTRKADASGVSGVGPVLEGCVYTDGPVYVRWTSATSPAKSEGRYNSLAEFLAIHVNSHPTNDTIITFNDGEVYEQAKHPEVLLSKPKRKRKTKLPEVGEEPKPVDMGNKPDEGRVIEVSPIKIKEIN